MASAKDVPWVKHAIMSSTEALKSTLKYVWKLWDVGPAVKIWVRLGLPPMQRALCLCVCELVKDWSHCYHLHILSLPPLLSTAAYTFTLWGLTPRQENISHVLIWTLSASHGCSARSQIPCVHFYLEISISPTEKGAQSYQQTKEMNRIDSSLVEIALPFMLYQILFCLKGCLFASWQGILLLKLY